MTKVPSVSTKQNMNVNFRVLKMCKSSKDINKQLMQFSIVDNDPMLTLLKKWSTSFLQLILRQCLERAFSTAKHSKIVELHCVCQTQCFDI